MAVSHRASTDEQPQMRASPTSSRASSDTEALPQDCPQSFRHQSAQTCMDDMPDGAVHHVHIPPSTSYSRHASAFTKPCRRSNIKASPTAYYGLQQASVRYTDRHASIQAQQRQQQQGHISPKLFKEARQNDETPIHDYTSHSLGSAGPAAYESGSPSSLASQGSNGQIMVSHPSANHHYLAFDMDAATMWPCAHAAAPGCLSVLHDALHPGQVCLHLEKLVCPPLHT